MECLKTFYILPSFVTRFNPNRPFGVASHDAGGANQLAAMFRHFKWKAQRVFLSGPAEEILSSQCDKFEKYTPSTQINELTSIVTSTSWDSDDEFLLRRLARDSGVYTIALLDHWVNYRERFEREGHSVPPDEIWVVDRYAHKIAKEVFNEVPIVLIGDYYSEEILGRISPIGEDTPNNLLYLLEPIRSDWGRTEPGEFQSLRFFNESIHKLGLPKDTQIRLKPHPSEDPNKYLGFVGTANGFPVSLTRETLERALSSARWVAGCQTFALTLALRAGREVFGTLPPWAPSCALPHLGIIHLRDRHLI